MKKYTDNALKEISKGNFGKAIEICDKAIGEEPDVPEYYEIRGDCFYNLGKYEYAAVNYNEASELTKKNKSDYSSLLLNKKGLCYIKLKEYKESTYNFNKAVKMDTSNYKAYNAKAKSLRMEGNNEDAVLIASKAISLKPDYAEAYNNRGSAYYNLSRVNESINDYTMAIKLKPDYAVAYFNRGMTYFYLKKDYIAAKLDWEKAIALNPVYEKDLKERLDAINRAYEKAVAEKLNKSYEIEKMKFETKISKPPVISSYGKSYTETKPKEKDKNISIKDGEFLKEGIVNTNTANETQILEINKPKTEEPAKEKRTLDNIIKEYESVNKLSDAFVEKEINPGDISSDKEEKIPDFAMPEELVKLHSEIVSSEEINKTEDTSPKKEQEVKTPPAIVQEDVHEKLPTGYNYTEPEKKGVGPYFWLYVISIVLLLSVVVIGLIMSGIFDEKVPVIIEEKKDTVVKSVVFIDEKTNKDTVNFEFEKSFEENLISKKLLLVETDSNFCFQYGSFKDSNRALQNIEALEEEGLDAYISIIGLEGKDKLYRVRFGNYFKLIEADSVAREFKLK